jgi:imidazolonepropionase-like amidohydrolase
MSLKMNFSFCTCDALLVPDSPRHFHQKLIKNVSIFNGESEELITGYDVVLEGHKIHSLIPAGSSAEGEDEYDAVIDGKGGYLTPGLIDIHWHTMFSLPMPVIINKSKAYVAAVACVESKKLLMRGVTTVRDAAGDVFGIKQAIDEGIIEGPRIYGSGAILSQYSGHGDFRNVNEVRINLYVCLD